MGCEAANPGLVHASGYLRYSHLHGDRLAVVSEDDLWVASLAGGVARRLTASPSDCSFPRLSPDGATLAYVGRDEGNPELYTMPVAGGAPVRITHLGCEALYLCGWSHDGR